MQVDFGAECTHPEFTDVNVTSVKTALSSAIPHLDQVVALLSTSSDTKLRVFFDKALKVRELATSLRSDLDHVF